MKRPKPWSDKEEDDSSSDESSSSDTESEGDADKSSQKSSKAARIGKRKSVGIDFEALKRHGYKGGLSVLRMPVPKETMQKQDWSWSTGKERSEGEIEESYKERQKTRAAIADGEELATALTQKEKKTFAQKEKRKRDLGQASRGKSYVEEEKRLLRDSGVYSGFDC